MGATCYFKISRREPNQPAREAIETFNEHDRATIEEAWQNICAAADEMGGARNRVCIYRRINLTGEWDRAARIL